MKVYYSGLSPFVRKVLVCAAELGLTIDLLPSQASPVVRDRTIVADNPLGKVPTFFADDGTVLYDSRVICEYLDTLGGGRLFPPAGPERWRALVEQSLADGILDAAILARYERLIRPEERQWDAWEGGQFDKITTGLDRLEIWAPELGERVDIGTITIGCAVGYLDYRFPQLAWRDGRAALAEWFTGFGELPSMVATRPPA